MDPGFAVFPLLTYAVAFACVGLVVGFFAARKAALFTTIGVVAIAFGLANGIFAPSPYKIQAGFVAFVLVGVVVGFVATLVSIARRKRRESKESTAV